MKKLFLFMAVATLMFSLNSCSSSDGNGGGFSSEGTITAKIDGVSKTFDTVSVDEEVVNPGTVDEYTQLIVIGRIGTSTTEVVTFTVLKGVTGSTAFISDVFSYTKNGVTYFDDGTTTTNVTTNSDSKSLIGTFSGPFTDGTTTITFTEGTFNIQY